MKRFETASLTRFNSPHLRNVLISLSHRPFTFGELDTLKTCLPRSVPRYLLSNGDVYIFASLFAKATSTLLANLLLFEL